jgi:DNA-binding transcriptional MerR regulator
MPKNSYHSISDLATEFAITTRAIRFYEEKGLLAPIRKGNTRQYSSSDKVKLKLILRGKRLGLTLDESRDIIEMYDPARGNVEQLKRLVNKIKDKQRQLQQQSTDLKQMMFDLHDAEHKCLEALKQAQNTKAQ